SVRVQATQTMTALLASIAGVSLLVGGIGIMNIMLVSVTERTREIGLRMAIGARGRDVLLQFLVEAIVLSLVGGTIGILLGFGLSQGVTYWMTWPTAVSAQAVGIAFGFAAMTGVFFGFYPARKAAALDPIEANLSNAKAVASRQEDLQKRGIATREQAETARTAAEALEATVAADRANIENAKVQLDYATISSPLDGRTGLLQVHPG